MRTLKGAVKLYDVSFTLRNTGQDKTGPIELDPLIVYPNGSEKFPRQSRAGPGFHIEAENGAEDAYLWVSVAHASLNPGQSARFLEHVVTDDKPSQIAFLACFYDDTHQGQGYVFGFSAKRKLDGATLLTDEGTDYQSDTSIGPGHSTHSYG